jgi:phosphopantetheinyl transferase
MSLATFQAHPFRAPYTVEFASVSAPDLGGLTRCERWEYDRLPRDNQARRRDWLAGRCAGKRAVAARCGLPVERVQLASRAGAGPRCMVLDGECWTHLPVSLSIAHCDGVAIAAAADSSTRIGVDIERVGEIAPEHRRYFLAPSEKCADASLAWVLKEAAWKALGLGLAVPFTAVQLSFDRETRALQGVRVDSTWMTARADVIRFSHERPLVAAVLEISRNKRDVS